FFNCMMEEGSSVSEHMFAMSGHAKKLSDLGIVIPNKLGIHRVLQSLPPSYKNFVMNYNMQNMNKELPELFSMLKSAEVEIKKENQVLMVNKTTSFKKQGKPNKGNFKKGGKKVAAPPEKPKAGPKPETVCYYCQGKGHWKRNCTKYLADLKSGHAKKKGIFDIHVIDVYLTGSRSSAWVFDTGSVAHICNSKQELRNKRSLARDEVTMRVGNGSKVDVIAVGTLPLHLPSGLVLNLNNCYLVPALSMNIISGSCLMQDGYSFKSENNGCSIYMSNVFYGHAPEMNGLFLLNLDSSDTHVHNIDAKRIKLNDNSTYMWHCRLGHIGVKRMKKLHSDGLLESLDFESLDRCEACLMGKMTKTPFSGTMERATDLLEIIHTDSSAVPEEVPVQPTPIGEEANDDDHETSNEEATEPRRSTRERTTPDWYDPCLNVMIVDNNDEDPATYEEAMMSPDSNKWQEAMKSEMGSMYDNKVWTLVDLPDSRKAVENKWIFKRKTDADGNITVYKARLVAKGFRQIQGVDYDETFSPVAKLKSVRILLAIAAFFDYEIWQMDVKTAFLNGDIEEELYMSGYVFILNGAAVSWSSSKQCTVAKSSTESEYIAASEASSEAVWMKRFIVELGVVPSALDPLVIYCDNTGAIANAKEPRSHKKLKHIKLRFHSIREYIEDGEVEICKVHTDLNVADPLTKALPRAKHDQHQNAMGVRFEYGMETKFVRSLGCDPGCHEEVRKSPENKIHIREVDFWVFGNVRDCSGVDWKVLEGSGRVHHGAHDPGGPPWAEGMLPGLMGQGHLAPKAQAGQPPRVSLGGSTWGRGKPLSPAAPPTLDGKGGHLGRPAPYIKRGGGGRPHHPPIASSSGRLSLHHTLSGLRRSPAVFFLHHHHHAVVLLDVGGDLPHLRCPLERERKELHRHRTRDRVRKCCRIAAPGTIVYTNNEINLVGFGIFEGIGQVARPRIRRDVCRALRAVDQVPRPTSSLGSPAFVLLNRCPPVGFGKHIARQWDLLQQRRASAAEMADKPVTYDELTDDHKKNYDTIKSQFEADLISSFERTRSHGIRWKGFSPEGVLDGIDLSLLQRNTPELCAKKSTTWWLIRCTAILRAW
ncbi:hypothetical protein QYE76_012342, partial [Lolium multiflorum]